MNKAVKGNWVKIYNILLQPDERANHLPDDTKSVPLEMWVKGFLLNETAVIGEKVTVESYIGRKIEGTLVEISPSYKHNYGEHIPELLFVGKQLRTILEGGESDE